MKKLIKSRSVLRTVFTKLYMQLEATNEIMENVDERDIKLSNKKLQVKHQEIRNLDEQIWDAMLEEESTTEEELLDEYSSRDKYFDMLEKAQFTIDKILKKIEVQHLESNLNITRKLRLPQLELTKLNDRFNLQLGLQDDDHTMEGDDTFSSKQVKSGNDLSEVIDQTPDVVVKSDNSDDGKLKPKYLESDYVESTSFASCGLICKDSDRELELESDDDIESMSFDSSGLFCKDSDRELELESDDDVEQIKKGLEFFEQETRKVDEVRVKNTEKSQDAHSLKNYLDYGDKSQKKAHIMIELWIKTDVFKNMITEKDEDHNLDKMVEEYKKDLIHGVWNRYPFNDEHLSDWFTKDEKKHIEKETSVPKELVEEYSKRMEDLNVRSIKKVIEAKVRKKKRTLGKFERPKKKDSIAAEETQAITPNIQERLTRRRRPPERLKILYVMFFRFQRIEFFLRKKLNGGRMLGTQDIYIMTYCVN